ncbi:MAG TPA: LuxR C-terminal-related transcriptional regulator [Streptosporangiaceae bacterium]|nr:LuxR C-terminal-related transcriptional regulator [Streptosporangiaceae bacterium]
MTAHSGVREPAGLTGRLSERDVLDRFVADVRAGEGRALAVRGEPGVGKTALLDYLAGRVTSSGCQVARTAGVQSEMELAFAGLHQLCAPLLEHAKSLPDPQRAALRAVFGLSAGPAPAHGDPAPDHLEGLPELRLGGLDEQSARALLATVIPGPLDDLVRDRILAETHGHPLALLELYRGRSAADLAGGFALPDAGDLPRRIEDRYAVRLGELPAEVQRLVLLAAADPVGDPALIFRAARVLGLDAGTVNLAAAAGLLELGENVHFRHPLVRSAAYRAAAADDRRAVHEALADVTDPLADPDRRAWHRAHATAGPDEAVAEELINSAGRAMRRGGAAAAAAFWARAVALTPEPGQRAARALTAAEAKYAAGDFEAAQALLVTAEVGPPGELGEARVQRMRAQVAFALRRGGDAPPLMLQAAQRLQSLDPELARQTYLEALIAAIYAGRLVHGQDARQVAHAARSATSPAQLLIHGLAVRLADGYVAAAPTLKEALCRYRAQPHELDWLSVAYDIVAMDLWDDEAWFELAAGQLRLARANGTLSWLPFTLDYLAELHVQAGELSKAAALVTERERVDPGTREATLPYVPLLLAAWRGDAPGVAELAGQMTRGASDRGEGAALTYTDYAQAVLDNGLGNYGTAAEAAHRASAVDELVLSPWALYELTEAAARSDQHDRACAAADQLAQPAAASASNWARGAAARSRALVSGGRAAEAAYREAIDLLASTRMATHLARARLVYGEWLRREKRRVEARDQLRSAFDALTSMGAEAFAERARRELLATGETVRKRSDDTRTDLTPQEEEIAQLASEGRTNSEIAAQLFIGRRTVEWHLHKVFAKLDIGSRIELNQALRKRSIRS